jgi:choline-glycine betaine transporter
MRLDSRLPGCPATQRKSMTQERPLDANVDKTNFAATIVIILLVSVPLALNPEAGAQVMQASYAFIATNFGWLYLLAGVSALILLLWLAFGRFGRVTLGTDGEAPEFSTYSWVAMLFCAGIGAGLMYWSAIEWAYYYDAPPFGAEPGSTEAARWASSYGVFHWGPIAWAFYCLPTLAIAYPFYAQKVPVLKYSVGCHFWLAGREENIFARMMDFLFMIALIGGAGSSLGFSTPLIATLISRLTGVEMGFGLEVAVVILCVVIFATSVYLGLERGIKRLSDLNLLLALFLLAYILAAGPTLFLVKSALNSVGIVAGFELLPGAALVIALFCFVSIVFSATTYDSASYILASSASHRLHPSEDPPRWHRSFWAMALAVLPITLMYIGGLKVAQTAVLVVSLPILFTMLMSTLSLLLSLRRRQPEQGA